MILGSAGQPASGKTEGRVPRPGVIVIYRLDAGDAEGVNRRRNQFTMFQALRDDHKHPHERAEMPVGTGATGHQAHIGLPVHEGMELPAIVVLTSERDTLVLQVILPGSDHLFVSNVPEGTTPGTWHARA